MTVSTSRPARRRSRRTVVLVFVLVVVLAVVTAVTWSVVAASDPTGSAQVDDDGFSMSVADTRISAPAGVAPVGTAVTAESATMDVSAVAWGGATSLGEGVDVTLEGDAQPQQPVHLEFQIPEDVQVPDGDVVLVVAAGAESDRPELLDARWDPENREVITTTDHFSKFQPILVNAQRATEGFGRELDKVIRSTTDAPACFGKDPLEGDGEIVVSPINDDAVWPCLHLDGEKLTLEMQNNSSLAWVYASDPEVTPSTPTASTAAGIVTAALHPYLEGGRAQAIVLPKEGGSVEYDVSDLPIQASLDASPGMMLLSALVTTLQTMMPPGVEWAHAVTKAECMAGIAKTVVDGSSPADVTVTVLNCFGGVVGGGAGRITTMMTGGPGALYGMVHGALGEIWNNGNYVPFEIELNVPAAASRLGPGERHLWEVGSSSGMLSANPSGEGVDSLILDNGVPHLWAAATSQWVGCDAEQARTEYNLDGDYTRLSATPGVRTGTPDGLTARFEFEVDGEVVHTASVTAGLIGEPFELDLTGAEELVVTAATDDECTNEDLAYGTLRATVTESGPDGDVDISSFIGSWSGPVDQGSRDYDLEVELTDNDGVLKAEVYYPQLRCRGTWTQQGQEHGVLLMFEEITEDPEETCAPEVEIVLDPTAAGLDVRLDPLTSRSSGGTATITRR